jgi:hypothetical protein
VPKSCAKSAFSSSRVEASFQYHTFSSLTCSLSKRAATGISLAAHAVKWAFSSSLSMSRFATFGVPVTPEIHAPTSLRIKHSSMTCSTILILSTPFADQFIPSFKFLTVSGAPTAPPDWTGAYRISTRTSIPSRTRCFLLQRTLDNGNNGDNQGAGYCQALPRIPARSVSFTSSQVQTALSGLSKGRDTYRMTCPNDLSSTAGTVMSLQTLCSYHSLSAHGILSMNIVLSLQLSL